MAIDQVATVEVRVNGEEAKQELKNLETIAKRSWQMLTKPVIHPKSSRSLPSFGKRKLRLRR